MTGRIVVRMCHYIHLGASNNYVDQSLPHFDPHPLEWTKMDILHTIYPLSRGLSTDLPTPHSY